MRVATAAPQSQTDSGERQCRRGSEYKDGLIEGLCLLLSLRSGGLAAHRALGHKRSGRNQGAKGEQQN
jgi:hypothetical protein